MLSRISLRKQIYSQVNLSKLFFMRTQSMSVNVSYLQFDEFGQPDKVVKRHETKLDAPKENEILVKILVAPINPADINIIQGNYLNLNHKAISTMHKANLNNLL